MQFNSKIKKTSPSQEMNAFTYETLGVVYKNEGKEVHHKD